MSIRWHLFPVLIALCSTWCLEVEAQKFRSDDPIRIDHDNLEIPRPQRRKINDHYDFLENTFFKPGDKPARRAVNINTLGEVPDSSWYTNRLSVQSLGREALVKGPNQGAGPVASLTIIGGKSQGITPGFTVTDAAGDTYFLKFDPNSNPEMATAAEIISSKFFHALGYNVPELYIVYFNPSDLQISPEATVKNELDQVAPMTRKFVDSVLKNAPRRADGTIRAIASKLVHGENLGPFKFAGTRRDDPNDIFPHEDRRELRGYRVFSAWLNHDDSRSVNTLDVFVPSLKDDGRGYVKHYLIDFGSTLGSGSVFAQKRRPGNEYLWEAKPTIASILSLGIWLRPWVSVRYPDYPAVGRFEADFFRPEKWKPEYPNPAFDKMDVEDAFWAARQVMQFSDDDIRAVVKTGLLSEPAAEEYLARCLILRRDKIGDYWLRQTSSLDDFRLESGFLTFDDVAVRYGFQRLGSPVSASVHSFINSDGSRTPVAAPAPVESGRVQLPAAVNNSADGSFFVITLTQEQGSVDVFLRKSSGAVTIVGIERRPAGA